MPHYEFFCQDCKKLFSKILSLVNHEEGKMELLGIGKTTLYRKLKEYECTH